MKIIDFITANYLEIITAIVFVAGMIFLYVRGEMKIFNKILYLLITEAEKQYGGGTGELKLAYVISQSYEKLPKVIRAFITLATLTKWINDTLTYAKEKWAENAQIKGYIDGGKDGDI